MKRVALLVCAAALLAASCTKPEPVPETGALYNDGVVMVAGQEVRADFATNIQARAQGLSGREEFEENQGMFFAFSTPDVLKFWMKDMKFAIDIIWIRGEEVVGISRDAKPEPGTPDSSLKIYSSEGLADRVLEVRAGWAARNGLKIGDKVQITPEITAED